MAKKNTPKPKKGYTPTKNGFISIGISFSDNQVAMLDKAANNGYNRTLVIRLAMQELAKAKPELFS